MKIYLAATYSKHTEMRVIRDILVSAGYVVTSRWIDVGGEDRIDPNSDSDRDACVRAAEDDIFDLISSDMVISFTEGGGKGGRHVEFGMAMALHIDLVLVGPRENIFHTIPRVSQYNTFEELLAFLGIQRLCLV